MYDMQKIAYDIFHRKSSYNSEYLSFHKTPEGNVYIDKFRPENYRLP